MAPSEEPQRIVIEADELLVPPPPPQATPLAPPAGQPLSFAAPGPGHPAGLPRRYSADFIDATIVASPIIAITLVLVLGAGLGVKTAASLFLLLLIVMLLTPVINVAYRVSMMMRPGTGNGQTLGRELFSVRVAMTGGDPVTAGDALVREIVWKDIVFGTLGMLLLGIPWILDLLSPLWHPQRRAWHDLLAGTMVVDAGASATGGGPPTTAPPLGEPLALAPPEATR